jgi:UDP-glucose:(heptosyl)LPS alpha-1,3-glucosyltransferase
MAQHSRATRLAQPEWLAFFPGVSPEPLSVAVVARRITGLSGITILIREHAARAAAAGWDTHVFGERVDARAIRSANATPHLLRPGFFRRRTAEWFAGAAPGPDGDFTLVHGHGDSPRQDVMSLHNCIHATHEAVHGSPLPADAPTAEVARMHELQLTERRFRRLITNSALMRDDVMSRFGVPADAIRVAHPGFDPARFHPRPRADEAHQIRRWLGVGEDDLLVGLVTSGDWVKRGVKDFVLAFSAVAHGSSRKVHGVVVGKERNPGRYQAMAGQAGKGGRLHFLPPSDRPEHVYGALDVFVYPAQFEEFGMVVLEAMACGLPVVCGRRIGATELLDPIAASVLLDRVTPETVAERLGQFAADADLRHRTGALNAACVVRHDWDRSAATVLATYRELAAS